MFDMKCLVTYFSQTGNTAAVARAIAGGLAESAGTTADVRPIREVAPADWLAYDVLALGMPVFYYHEPTIVRDWIRAMAARPAAAPVLTFNTNGGNPCNTFRRVQKFLRPKGGRVVGSFECGGYDTYPIYMKSFRQWTRPDAEDLAAAADFGRRTAGKAAAMLGGEPVPEAAYRFVGGKTFRLSWICRKPVLEHFFPKLNLDPGACIRCGACARACPAGNISLAPDPQFDRRCIHCYLCERICPRNAIRCDWRRLTKMMNP
jgi:flavodoxin/NAD-dependent dihydropyrimidine dehydrogenase PreA subunit